MANLITQKRRVNVRNQEALKMSVAFGWKGTGIQQVRRGRFIEREQVLIRQSSQEHFEELCQMEEEYSALKKQVWNPKPTDPSIGVLLYALFIIPGIAYSLIRFFRDHKKVKNNQILQKKMQDLIRQGRELQGLPAEEEIEKTEEAVELENETTKDTLDAKAEVPQEKVEPEGSTQEMAQSEDSDETVEKITRPDQNVEEDGVVDTSTNSEDVSESSS